MTKDVLLPPLLEFEMNYQQALTNMIKSQLRTSYVLNPHILGLFKKILRKDFVPKKYKPLAYADISIPLEIGGTMMPPKEEGIILQSLAVKSSDRALLIGIDSGYLATLLTKLAHHVFYLSNEVAAIERVQEKTAHHQCDNITFMTGSINHGWEEIVPIDVILVTGSVPDIPNHLKESLALKGRLFVIVGKSPVMEAMLITRTTEHTWDESKIFETDRPRLLDIKDPDSFVF